LPQCEAIFDQCIDANIPIALFAHGGTYGIIDHYPIDYFPLQQKSKTNLYMLVYSSEIASYGERILNNLNFNNPQNISVGSVYYDNLLQKNNSMESIQKDNVLRICYVCSGIGIYSSFFKNSQYDDAALYNLRYRALNKLRNNSNLKVFFKMSYDTDKYNLKLEQDIINHKYENINPVLPKNKFINLLDKADIFILETPSTPLLEALTTSKPIIVMVDPRSISFAPAAKKIIQKRVTIAESGDELINYIEDIIINNTRAKAFIQPDHRDFSFINKYVSNGNYDSIKRASIFLEGIAV